MRSETASRFAMAHPRIDNAGGVLSHGPVITFRGLRRIAFSGPTLATCTRSHNSPAPPSNYGDQKMAMYLPKSDALFVHIPKCGGHFVEDVFKACGIEYEHTPPITNACGRHGRASDHRPASFTFCTTRDLDGWMLSYWRFHMLVGHNRKVWEDGVDYPHRVLGPPLLPWQEFKKQMTAVASQYLTSMEAGCDHVIDLSDINAGLATVLASLGYNVTEKQVAAVPRANVTRLCVELGGGTRQKGKPFANIDVVPEADFNWDLDQTPYPFPSASVDEVYSSHCLEHLECPHRTLHEIARICKVGARVEIRVPHPASHMAMCAGHKHVLSPLMIDNMDIHFPELHWRGPRRLKLQSLTYGPTPWMDRAKEELPFLNGLDDQTIMRWIPNTCHESIFIFEVQNV